MGNGEIWVYHYRTYKLNDFPDRVFIESTHTYPNGEVYRTWYCPSVQEYKGYKKTKMNLHGCAGLKYWFNEYVHKTKKN